MTNKELVEAINEYPGGEVLLKGYNIRISKDEAEELLEFRKNKYDIPNHWDAVFPQEMSNDT